MQQEEHLDTDVESDIDDNTTLYHQYKLDNKVQDVPTEVSSAPPALGSSNPWNLKQAKLSRPTLYDGHALLNTTHSPVRVNDSKDALVQAEVSRASQNSNPPKPVTLFVHTHLAPSKVRTQLLKLKECFPAFETIIKRRTTPTFHEQGEWLFVHTKKAFTEQVIPFYEHVKELVQSLDENLVKEVTEFMRIFDELDIEYEECVLEKKNLQIEKKNLLIQNEGLITNSIAKDICSIVLASDRDRPLSEELSSNCVRENSKVIELEAEILNQLNFKKIKSAFGDNSHSPADNTVFEINQLKEQLQGKDDTIRKLQTQINNMSMLNVGPTVCSFNKHALETELTQLKDAITSVRIQNDGYQAENVNLKRRYEELSKSNAYSRSTFTAKINALTVENAKLKTELSGKKSSGSTASKKPKLLASGMYTNKPNLPLNLARNHRILPSKSVNLRRAADHNRELNVVDHNQFVIRSLKSVNTKTPQAKHSMNHTKKIWKATRNHNVNTTKTAWRPTRKVVGSVKPQWKPTRQNFALYDNCPLTRIMEPIVEPLELTPSVSSSSKVTMISRFTDCKLSDRKAGSKGLSGIF
ncbi:hypothetical protein Tco_1424599 [Tanacetum coccineum]